MKKHVSTWVFYINMALYGFAFYACAKPALETRSGEPDIARIEIFYKSFKIFSPISKSAEELVFDVRNNLNDTTIFKAGRYRYLQIEDRERLKKYKTIIEENECVLNVISGNIKGKRKGQIDVKLVIYVYTDKGKQVISVSNLQEMLVNDFVCKKDQKLIDAVLIDLFQNEG